MDVLPREQARGSERLTTLSVALQRLGCRTQPIKFIARGQLCLGSSLAKGGQAEVRFHYWENLLQSAQMQAAHGVYCISFSISFVNILGGCYVDCDHVRRYPKF